MRCVFTFTIAYVSGIGIYYSQKKNYRRGVEHGSAKWGDAASICKRYRDKRYTQNLILTQNFRMGLDCYKHTNTVLSWLRRARAQLHTMLKEEIEDEVV